MGDTDSGPVIAQRAPFVAELAPGEYRWCACGRSGNDPFCDGSHAGTGLAPCRFSVRPRAGTLFLCQCKHTKTPPFCDGTHNKLGPPLQA